MGTQTAREGAGNRQVAQETRAIAVVIERRDIDNPWIDYTWHAIAVVDGVAGEHGWRDLETGDGFARFMVTGFEIGLYSGETEGYKINLSQPAPFVYVVLRPGEEADENDVEPFKVTVCPYEAMGYADSGDEQVDGVEMPASIGAWVQAFVDSYHVEETFKKRKRDAKSRDKAIYTRPRGRFTQ